MDAMATTHNNDGFNERLNRLVLCLVYEQPIPEGSNAYEVVAAKLLLKWQSEAVMESLTDRVK